MPGYNTNFELSIEDLELIEDALRRKKREFSDKLIVKDDACEKTLQDADTRVRGIHDLLGRIHNQKIFYRPSDAPYISG